MLAPHQISLGSDAVSSGATFFACFSLPSPVAGAAEAGRVVRSLRITRGSCRGCAGPLPFRGDLQLVPAVDQSSSVGVACLANGFAV